MSIDNKQKLNTLILDAGPLITQSASQLQQYAEKFYTTPGVYNELKDEHARNQLILWHDNLIVRHPKVDSITAVVNFAKLTGDSTVLSQNDLHILALAYELDVETNGGVCRLRTYPGEITEEDKKRREAAQKAREERELKEPKEIKQDQSNEKEEETEEETEKIDDDGFITVTHKKFNKNKKRGKKQQESKPEPIVVESIPEVAEEPVTSEEHQDALPVTLESISPEVDESLKEEYTEDQDDGEWITPDNLYENMKKDDSVKTTEVDTQTVKSALATGDFAIQNVALQMGLHLMNAMSGLQIKRVRNYMLRCHACFDLVPIPKDGTPKHFCPSCGGATLLRCAVSINSKTGAITPHLKKNFEWHNRGNIYSVASPLSKNFNKKYGNKGYQHRGNSKLDATYFTEDQREYQNAIKNAKWQVHQNEKAMQDFIGGGSADNFISPFFTGADTMKPVNIRIGRGRYANAPKSKKK